MTAGTSIAPALRTLGFGFLVRGFALLVPAAARLAAKGVGPLAPVGTNTTEEGRKLNRRVELVAMQ